MGVVYLVRHAQASAGKPDYDQLSRLGFEQARVLGSAMKGRLEGSRAAYIGRMKRHRQTAEACLAAADVRLEPKLMAGFDEFDHEEIIERYEPRYANRLVLAADMAKTLKPRRAFQTMFNRAIERWVSGGHDGDYAEPWPSFRGRCVGALDGVIEALGPSKVAVVFTSGGPITAIAQDLLGIPDERAFRLTWTLTNCGVTKVVYGASGKHLSTLNDHAHFDGSSRSLITYR